MTERPSLSVSRKSSFAAPSRLQPPPTLKPSPSLSNLRVHSHGTTSTSPSPEPGSLPRPKESALNSSASSMVTMDMPDGTLVQETDSIADQNEAEDQSTPVASVDQAVDSKQLLREQLKRSLSNRVPPPESTDSSRRQEKHPVMNEIAFNAASRYVPREYFVLTDAGKPVFVSRPGADDQDNTASVIGVMQALISVFIDDGDKLRCITAGPTRITFLQRSPLYYVCVSSWGEPESTDMLYIVVVARDRVLTLIRPRRHSIHPADLHIILNTIHTPSVYNNPMQSSCIPFCLPKFNPTGFVNAFVSFLRTDEYIPSRPVSPTVEGAPDDETPGEEKLQEPNLNDHGVALICITAGSDFEPVRAWGEAAVKKLAAEGILRSLLHSFRIGQTEYSVSELGIPGLRHFVYKSRAQVQTTSPTFEEPYDKLSERKRLITLYQTIHDAIHARSGQEAPLKLQYVRTEHEGVLGWSRLFLTSNTTMSLLSSLTNAGARLSRSWAAPQRSFATTVTSVGAARAVPPPQVPGKIRTPTAFLTAIGRKAETKVQAEGWEQFWNMSGQDLRKAGLAVKDRRYILWCMEKFRQGEPIEQFAHEPASKKAIRGWGPKVQNGKRIRSKRIKDKTKKNRS
ncbi:vacuolar fusion protein MON1 [Coprinopsis sp. MPI-PUGE-AT-0042]|nr:vacuolar fusion protein MON1 [Coprinopsis sp. MPI-PUGE-AT-0042]